MIVPSGLQRYDEGGCKGQQSFSEKGTMMSWLILSIVVFAGQLDGSAADENSEVESASPRRLIEIDRAIREAMRAEATAQTDGQQAEAVQRMVEIYREILADPRLNTSDTLKSYRARLWSRMTRIKLDLERRLERERQQQARNYTPEQLESIEAATRSLSEQIVLMNYTMGGPSYVLQQGGGALGGAAVQDHAQELIELIQRTIKPNFWDAAGGPGSMFYYRPLMALVVSATSEVHDNVGGLLQALRRAGQ
jgi:hypothetical protein